MECERLKKLLKTWYIQVQDESLAPARMVTFMKQHLADCPVCMTDLAVRQEVQKITEIILPPSKVRTPPSSTKTEGPSSAPATGKAAKVQEETGDEDQEEEKEEDDDEDGDEDDEDSDDEEADDEGL